jgi:N-acetylmuramic acid 6-phosphate etherase
MSSSPEQKSSALNVLVIGVDGGGTRTRARLANGLGETLGSGEAGLANPNASGFEAAKNEILSAVDRAFQDARMERRMVAAACLGISGVDRPGEREHFVSWAGQALAPHVQVVNDGETVLAAGSSENWGVALIAGTGSIAWGKTHDHPPRIARAGGWGYMIGDEGSGFDLGREALRAVTQSEDRRGEPTRLRDAILGEWGMHSAAELIPKVYRSGLVPADFARLAPLVVRCAEESDQVALRLIERTAAALANMVVAAARQLQFPAGDIPLALTGGLLLQAKYVRTRLAAELERQGAHFSPTALVHEPVAGAVRMAIELMRDR